MEQTREVERGSGAERFAAAPSVATPPGMEAETMTAMLRRCTALAAQARVDLLAPSRCGVAAELLDLLAQMQGWERRTQGAPDPTMLVLAAAALQDLQERLVGVADDGGAGPALLALRAEAVLAVLHEMMGQARIDVPA